VPVAIRLSPNNYHPQNAVALVQWDLNLEIDDLQKETEASVKDYFTGRTYNRKTGICKWNNAVCCINYGPVPL